MVKNSLQRTNENEGNPLTIYLNRADVKANIASVLGEKEVQRFISSIVSATTTNSDLKRCTKASIVSAALLGEALGLSPSPQLGQFYMVPYENNKAKTTEAQFQLGYKGYIQLALRTGQYRKLNVLAIKAGELIHYDPLNEEIEVRLIDDEDTREATETVGYYAFFEYLNGFRKCMYWSKKKMESHALKYSKGYAADKRKGTNWTFWSKDFEGMAYKTMLRQLISKWGIMSTEMQMAITSDMGVIGENGTVNYVDGPDFNNGQMVEPSGYEIYGQPPFQQPPLEQPMQPPFQQAPFEQSAPMQQPAMSQPPAGPEMDAQQALFGGADNF